MDTAYVGSPVARASQPTRTEPLAAGDFMLVPHGYGTDASTQVWVGSHNVQVLDRLWLRCEPVPAADGAMAPAYESSCRDIPLRLDRQAEGLNFAFLSIPTVPGCRYRLTLWQWDRGEAVVRARAECRGKPDGLRNRFNLWYGTCFYRHGDNGALAEAFSGLPEDYRPDVSFLGGDQVYLDTAFSNRGFVFTPGFSTANFSPLALRPAASIRQRLNRIFTREYQANWGGGLRELLSYGNHYFLAGDHEFWNDYPNPPGFLPALWSGKVRRIWAECARTLFNAYQLPHGNAACAFEVGEDLSFFVLDTRLQRGRGTDGQFTDPATLRRLEDWLTGLTGPGVLVLPAPILTPWQFRGAGIGRALMVKLGFGDHSLADTGQYEALVRALNACPQDVLIMAGDVHFSRLARFELNGKQVVEVVSSPLSCLPSAAAVADQRPNVFPDRPADGIRAEVEYLKAGTTRAHKRAEISNNNFVTLSFTRADAGVRVEVVCWNISARNERGEPVVDWDSRELLLRAHNNEKSS